jgi:hypothetical protein
VLVICSATLILPRILKASESLTYIPLSVFDQKVEMLLRDSRNGMLNRGQMEMAFERIITRYTEGLWIEDPLDGYLKKYLPAPAVPRELGVFYGYQYLLMWMVVLIERAHKDPRVIGTFSKAITKFDDPAIYEALIYFELLDTELKEIIPKTNMNDEYKEYLLMQLYRDRQDRSIDLYNLKTQILLLPYGYDKLKEKLSDPHMPYVTKSFMVDNLPNVVEQLASLTSSNELHARMREIAGLVFENTEMRHFESWLYIFVLPKIIDPLEHLITSYRAELLRERTLVAKSNDDEWKRMYTDSLVTELEGLKDKETQLKMLRRTFPVLRK